MRRRTMIEGRRTLALSVAGFLIGTALFTGCSAGTGDAGPDSGSSSGANADGFDAELAAELEAMAERDQAGMTGGVDEEGPAARVARLEEIIDEHGWPTITLVGDDGADAAWLIAQHADLQPEFQETALDLLRDAAEEGEASLGNLAYLSDRVDVAQGRPQTYGTQIRCAEDGTGAQPATPLVDTAQVDALREEAGLDPLADYIAEMNALCASDE